MIGEGTRQLDLYDFFSILVPGAGFLIGLVPFLPQDIPIPTSVLLGGLIIGGFIVGRWFHAVRMLIERDVIAVSHREHFTDQLVNPTEISEDLADQFYDCCQSHFDNLHLPDKRDELEEHPNDLNTLYTTARSLIHMDSRGRSRTFQAVLDFYGSALLASGILSIVYVSYAIVDQFSLNNDLVGYAPYLVELDFHPVIIFAGASLAFGSAYFTFKRVRGRYRTYFVQYLMSDFIILHNQTNN